MKITVINRFYPPDPRPTGRLAQSLAEHRAAQGDEVTVIAGLDRTDTQQPNCRVGPAVFKNGGAPALPVQLRAIEAGESRKKPLWRRVHDYAAFFVRTVWTTIWLPRQDVLICLTTPPFIVLAGVVHKLFHPQARIILWNMDCYPEVVERAGIIKRGGFTSSILRWLNRRLESAVDHTVCLDQAMWQMLSSRSRKLQAEDAVDRTEVTRPSLANSATGTLSVIANWESVGQFPASLMRRRGGQTSAASEFIVLYSGNMGYGHCFDTVIAAADYFHHHPAPVRFVFTGGGIQLSRVRHEVQRRKLTNVNFREHIPDDQFRALQRSAGCALITLKEDMLGVMSPSKLHASLAMGLPVLYVGPSGSNVDEAVTQFGCGVSLRHGDLQGFVRFVERLRSNADQASAFARRARQAFETAYSDVQCLPLFDQVIDSLSGDQLAQSTPAAEVRQRRAA